VRDPAEDHGRCPAEQHDVVAGGEVEQHRLDVGHVAVPAVGQPLPERRALLGAVPQLDDALVEALGRARDDLAVREGVAGRRGDVMADLVT